MANNHNVRQMLLDIGIGDFVATQCVQTMMMGPHQTDPDMPPVILITRHVQLCLNSMGADIPVSGMIDEDTDRCLQQICGDGYLTRPWWMLVNDVLEAMNGQRKFNTTSSPAAPMRIKNQKSLGDYLPDVPGGTLTYAAAALAVGWFLLKGKKRR